MSPESYYSQLIAVITWSNYLRTRAHNKTIHQSPQYQTINYMFFILIYGLAYIGREQRKKKHKQQQQQQSTEWNGAKQLHVYVHIVSHTDTQTHNAYKSVGPHY